MGSRTLQPKMRVQALATLLKQRGHGLDEVVVSVAPGARALDAETLAAHRAAG